MEIEQPNEEFARMTAEGYMEDGVQAFPLEREGKWYTVLNEKDYARYMTSMKRREAVVLKNHGEMWGGVNLQGQALDPPDEKETRLNLYILDMGCQTIKGFKISNSARLLMDRQTRDIEYGTRCEKCGGAVRLVLTWENPR